ncbi:MAG: HNH endonuclease signature motif containing protein [Patescibacteria group bacterium]
MANRKTILAVWEKAKEIRGQDPDSWRRDMEGNKIRFASYGTRGDFGWEIDHKYPSSKGGSGSLRNLQPLHWQENREKGDKA